MLLADFDKDDPSQMEISSDEEDEREAEPEHASMEDENERWHGNTGSW